MACIGCNQQSQGITEMQVGGGISAFANRGKTLRLLVVLGIAIWFIRKGLK